MDKTLTDFLDKLPFITYGVSNGVTYIGILNARSKNFTSIYVLDAIPSSELRKRLVELGEIWWWQCNRNLPISVFMPEKMEDFIHYKRTFITKDFTILKGPTVSISNIPTKRIKRCTNVLKPKKPRN